MLDSLGELDAIVDVWTDAAMALDVAECAYVLEVGEVTLDGPSERLAATTEVQQRYLGGSASTVERSDTATATARTPKKVFPMRTGR